MLGGRKRAASLLALVVASSLALLLAPSSSVGAPVRSTGAVVSDKTLGSGILGEVNAVRAQHGLAPLRASRPLAAAAAAHSRSMGLRGYFSHDSSDGSAFWRRIKTFYGIHGYRFWSVGENLLWSSSDLDPTGAVRLWMGSPEHRANMLNARWREIGISAVRALAAPGVFGGLSVTIVTADFGVRR